MKRILVWDLPTRLFHWLFAAGFVTAFVLAEAGRGARWVFALHMLIGLVVAVMAVLRILWGVVGSRFARFSSFSFGPRALLGYLRGAFGSPPVAYVGHNPGSSHAAVAMLACALGLGATGLLMPSLGHDLAELHELCVHLLLLLALVHVVGVAWHGLRHRDGTALSMWHGEKPGEPEQAIPTSHRLVGLLFLLLVGLAVLALARGFDGASAELRVPGMGVTVGGGSHRTPSHGIPAGHDRRPAAEDEDAD